MGFIVWKPNQDGLIIPVCPSARLLSLGKVEDFVIPILKVRRVTGERKRLMSFLNQEITIMDCYNSLVSSVSKIVVGCDQLLFYPHVGPKPDCGWGQDRS